MSSKTKRVSLALITNSQDNILMGKRNDNDRWTIPGGHLRNNECPFVGVARECLEETGLIAKKIKMVRAKKVKGIMLYLFVVEVDPEQVPDASNDPDKEVDEWDYTDPNDVRDNLHVAAKDNIAIEYWAYN